MNILKGNSRKLFCIVVFSLLNYTGIYAQQTQRVLEVSWNRTGNRIASYTDGGRLTIVDYPSNQITYQVERGQNGNIRDIAWNPINSELLAVAQTNQGTGYSGVTIINVSTGQEIHTYELVVETYEMMGETYTASQGDDIGTLAWSPNGNELAMGTRFIGPERLQPIAILFYDLKQSKVVKRIGRSSSILSLAWNKDYLAAAQVNNSVALWDAQTLTEVAEISGPRGIIGEIAWHPTQNRLALSYNDNQFDVWDIDSNANANTRVSIYGDRFLNLTWSPNGEYIATTSSGSEILIWNAQTGELATTITTQSNVRHVSWSPNGTQFTYGASSDGTTSPIMLIPSPVLLTPTVISFDLEDVTTKMVFANLDENDTVDLNILPANIAVYANTVGVIGSVVFNLDGVVTIDNEAPFTVPLDTTLGARTLTATPYSGSDGTGDTGTPLTVSFTVTGG